MPDAARFTGVTAPKGLPFEYLFNDSEQAVVYVTFVSNFRNGYMNKNVILFGEYLLRLTPPPPQKLLQAQALEMHWAGSEANIAVSLSLFGEAVTYITCMPRNAVAEAGLAQLHKHNVQTRIHWKEGRVGLYFYESGLGTRSGKVLYDREHSAFSFLEKGEVDWETALGAGDWFHWSGITPALNQRLVDVCAEALACAKKRGLTISADFNYRSTLWTYGKSSAEVMPELLQYCDVVLADVDAAKLYFNIKPDEGALVESTCALLKEKLPHVRYIAMTMRHQSSDTNNTYTGYLWQDGAVVASQAYPINAVAERIGTGDAFMAGLIHALRRKKPASEAIEFATACGAIKHTLTGDFNVASHEDVDLVIKQSGRAKIIR
jgi:2-dehydro-3-deoxygluconokinase